MEDARSLRRLAGIKQRVEKRMREDAARLKGKVDQLHGEELEAERRLREGRMMVAAATQARHAEMASRPASRKELAALFAGIECDQQSLQRKAADLGERRQAHAAAVVERSEHNRRLTRVQRQCEGLDTLIRAADAAAEVRAEFEQD